MFKPDKSREMVDLELLHEGGSVVVISVNYCEWSGVLGVFGQLLGSGDVLRRDNIAMAAPRSVEHGEHEGVFYLLLLKVRVVEHENSVF